MSSPVPPDFSTEENPVRYRVSNGLSEVQQENLQAWLKDFLSFNGDNLLYVGVETTNSNAVIVNGEGVNLEAIVAKINAALIRSCHLVRVAVILEDRAANNLGQSEAWFDCV